MKLSFLHRRHTTSLPPLAVLNGPRNTTPRPATQSGPAAPVAAAPVGIRYEVEYDRVGEHGRGVTLPPPRLTVRAATRAEIEAAIVADVAVYLPAGAQARVIADLSVMAGQIRIGDRPAGTFSLRMLTGGAR